MLSSLIFNVLVKTSDAISPRYLRSTLSIVFSSMSAVDHYIDFSVSSLNGSVRYFLLNSMFIMSFFMFAALS